MSDLASGEAKRLTWNASFDGFPLNVGPENNKGVPPKSEAPPGWKLPVEKSVTN